MLLPVLCKEPLGPEPEGVRVLLLVGTGMLELDGCLAFKPVGGPETDVFLDPGREVLILVGVEVVGVLVE